MNQTGNSYEIHNSPPLTTPANTWKEKTDTYHWFRSTSHQRLKTELPAYELTLAALIQEVKTHNQSTGPWQASCENAIEQAWYWLQRRNPEAAWRCLNISIRTEVYALAALSAERLKQRAISLKNESEKKLSGWRHASTLNLLNDAINALTPPDPADILESCFLLAAGALEGKILEAFEGVVGVWRPRVPVVCSDATRRSLVAALRERLQESAGKALLTDAQVTKILEVFEGRLAELQQSRLDEIASGVFEAQRLLQEHYANEHMRSQALRVQAIWLVLIAFIASSFWILLLLWNPVAFSFSQTMVNIELDLRTLTSVLTFAILGASFSGLRALAQDSIKNQKLPDVLYNRLVAFIRLGTGAMAALVLFMILKANVFNFGDNINFALVCFLSFVAGFSEKFVVGFIERYAGEVQGK